MYLLAFEIVILVLFGFVVKIVQKRVVGLLIGKNNRFEAGLFESGDDAFLLIYYIKVFSACC